MTALRYAEMIMDTNNPQSAYVSRNTVVGTRDIGLVRVEDNPAGAYHDAPCAENVLMILRQGAGNARVDYGAGELQKSWRSGDMTLAPIRTTSEVECHFDFAFDSVALPPALLSEAHDALGKGGEIDIEALHSTAFRDPLIDQLVRQLYAEAEAGNPSGATFVDHLSYVLAGSLLRLAGTIKAPPEPARALNRTELGRVTAMIEARLDEKLNLNDLAEPLGLDIFTFSRAFRGAVGTSPHQYLIARRVARVKDMLESSGETLSAIAYECGFGSQQHMTATFSKHFGISPGAYRKAHLS